MLDLGFIVYVIAVSYVLGTAWYALLGRQHTNWMRMAAFPFVGVVIGEALWSGPMNGSGGLDFHGLHIYVALVSSLAGVAIDVVVGKLAKVLPISEIIGSDGD